MYLNVPMLTVSLEVHVCVSCIKKLQLAESDFCTFEHHHHYYLTFWYFLKLRMLEMEGRRWRWPRLSSKFNYRRYMWRYVKSPMRESLASGRTSATSFTDRGTFGHSMICQTDVLGSFYSNNKSRLVARTSISGHCIAAWSFCSRMRYL